MRTGLKGSLTVLRPRAGHASACCRSYGLVILLFPLCLGRAGGGRGLAHCALSGHGKQRLGRWVGHTRAFLWARWSSANVRASGCCRTQGVRRMYKPGRNGLGVDVLVVGSCCVLLLRTWCGVGGQHEQQQKAWLALVVCFIQGLLCKWRTWNITLKKLKRSIY